MALTVVWKEGMHFCAEAPSGRLTCDESSPVGKAYPSAPELLLASLGSCIASVMVYFADRHGLDLEGLALDMDYDVAESPHRIGAIDISVRVPRGLSEEQRATLARVADTCLIHNTLHHPPKITLQLAGQ